MKKEKERFYKVEYSITNKNTGKRQLFASVHLTKEQAHKKWNDLKNKLYYFSCIEEKPATIASCHGEEPTPNDEDCYIQDDTRGRYSVSCGGKYLNSFSDFNDALTAINVWMKNNNFYPNIWIVDDHGGAVCIDGKGKEISGGSSTTSKRKKGKKK